MQELEQAIREAVPEPQMEKMPEVGKEWRPSNQEVLQEYDLGIRFLSRGCIVKVGCKEIAFESVTAAMEEINAYVCGNTWEVQQKWRKLLNM